MGNRIIEFVASVHFLFRISETALYCTVLYCTVLYCTVLYCSGYCPHYVVLVVSATAGVVGMTQVKNKI